MLRTEVETWIERYERLWRTAGTSGLAVLFSEDVRYQPSPWSPALEGLPAVAEFWESERDGPDEGFTLTSSVVAVDDDTAVARVEVTYRSGSRWRDLWVIRLDAAGRCTAFEEWPFAPGQSDGHQVTT